MTNEVKRRNGRKAWEQKDFDWNRTSSEIAAQMNVTNNTVLKWANRLGKKLKAGRSGIKGIEWDKVEWERDGKPRSFNEIACEIGCTRQAVYLAAKHRGIENPMWQKREFEDGEDLASVLHAMRHFQEWGNKTKRDELVARFNEAYDKEK